MTRNTGHHGENPSETLTRFIVEHTLGVRVCSYDDRSGTSRVDAIVHRRGGVPLEIVSDPWVAGNEQTSALDKKARGLFIRGLQSGYKIQLTATARVNQLGWVETTLRRLEDPQTRDGVPRRTDNYDSIVVWPMLEPGRVIFATGSGGGRADSTALEVMTAASDILTKNTDVARKLRAHGGLERHAVLIVDEDQTPAFAWLREGQPHDVRDLPAPELEDGITHLWIAPRLPQALTMRWSSRDGWAAAPWQWGDPVTALDRWHDPLCSVAHDPDPRTLPG